MTITAIRSGRTNNRRFPGIKGPRPDKAAYRKEAALKRQAAYAALPLEEKVRRNPKRYTDQVA